MISPTTQASDTSSATHTVIQVNSAWTRMDVPGGWIYTSLIGESRTGQLCVSSVFVPEPFAITEADVKHESGKLKVLKAILPLLGRIIRR